MSGKDVLEIGDVIRHAIVFNVNNWREGAMSTDSLFAAVERLFALLEERRIDYLLVGGIALLKYVEGRNTEDIDLILARSALADLPEIEVTSADEDFAHGRFGALKVDLLSTSNRLFDKVRREHATTVRFAEREIPCATVEGLLLLKLYALPSLYRQGNFARVNLYEGDVAALLDAYQPDLAPLYAELSWHLSASDLKAVKGIAAEIEARLARFRRGLEG
jgi:predicted nucleotidyltransferase